MFPVDLELNVDRMRHQMRMMLLAQEEEINAALDKAIEKFFEKGIDVEQIAFSAVYSAIQKAMDEYFMHGEGRAVIDEAIGDAVFQIFKDRISSEKP